MQAREENDHSPIISGLGKDRTLYLGLSWQSFLCGHNHPHWLPSRWLLLNQSSVRDVGNLRRHYLSAQIVIYRLVLVVVGT